MKRLGHLYEKLLDPEYMEQSIYRAFKKKKKTNSIKRILSDPRKHAIRIVYLLKNGILPYVRERKIKMIQDGTQKKWRSITKASNYEHVLHHAIIGLIENKLMSSMYKFSVASVPNRGDLYGKRYLQRWIKSFHGRKVYVLKFDIRKFFDSIDRIILLDKLSSIIKDRKFIEIISKIIFYDKSSTNRGVPIGHYTSQWFANFYLQSFDYFVKQKLSVKRMMRYMDDVVILCSNKRLLHKIFESIKRYMKENLVLSVKDNYQIFKLSYRPNKYMIEDGWISDRFYGRPIDFMGYKFYPWKTTIRKSTLRSAKRSVRSFLKNRTARNAKSVLSYYGRLSHSNAYYVYKNSLNSVVPKMVLTRLVSTFDRKDRVA